MSTQNRLNARMSISNIAKYLENKSIQRDISFWYGNVASNNEGNVFRIIETIEWSSNTSERIRIILKNEVWKKSNPS